MPDRDETADVWGDSILGPHITWVDRRGMKRTEWPHTLTPERQAALANLLPLAAVAQRDEVRALVEAAKAAAHSSPITRHGQRAVYRLADTLRPFDALAEDPT